MKRQLKTKPSGRARLGRQPDLPEPPTYILRLVIAGTSQRSTIAVMNLKSICERYLRGRYELEIIDIYQQPELAERLEVVAAPTLLKQLPLPLRRLVGDLSQVDRIVLALGLPPEARDPGGALDNSLNIHAEAL